MNHRENLVAAMKRQPCRRVPFQFSLCESLKAQMRQRYGTDDFVHEFDMPVVYVELPDMEPRIDYRSYHKNMQEISYLDEWGVGHSYGSVAHFTRFHAPMADFDTPKQVWDYPFPDILEQSRWEAVREQVERAHLENRAAAFFAIQVFEPAWYLRGLENLLSDFLSDPEMAAACMEKMEAIQCAVAKKAAICGADMIVFGDDIGTQRAMMMSASVWRRWIKPATAATIAAAKAVNPHILAMYHSDGAIAEVVPELIEIGVDILNPIQPECMNVEELKQQYGGHLSFWGGIGTQTTMPFATPQQVREVTKRMIETMGRGGGFTVAPTHLLEPEVPWENLEAFVNTVREFGEY